RYDMMRQLQQGTQPQSTLPLNSVRESAVLAPLPEPTPTPGVPSERRIEGTRLVPPPLMPMNNSRLGTGPLKGALPPTADPTSARELP
ncbi:MAG: type II secretion system protein GspD, partial [Variovorax sp.]